MALTAGTKLGPYEIVEPLGAGGMGEVYRARDARLGRDVAIKVLPEHLAQDPASLARFEREARAVAGLSHPNILAIHDFGVEGRTAYSVTELLEGETLGRRLGSARMPVRKVLDYGVQIAQGLAAAHEKGVIHRDLKPDNIFITEDGRAKILDFGLAKVAPPVEDGLTASPTVEAATRPGTVMGTMGYMSPEQVRGRDVDARSDLFSLGSILYEMLSGQKAFRRDTPADTLSAILQEDPPALSASSQEVAPALQRIVEHCLEKNEAERFQSARDLAFHLEQISTGSSSVTATSMAAVEERSSGKKPRVALFLAGLAVGAVAGGLLAARLVSPEPYEPPSLRYLSYSGRESQPSASPDGRLIAYRNSHGGRSQIWVKQFPGGDEVALTDGPDDQGPRISPDGSQVLFTRGEGAQQALFRIPLVGGEPRKVLDNAYDGDWSPQGDRIAFLRDRLGDDGLEVTLGTVSPAGQERRDLITVTAQRFGGPRWAPDGRTIAVFQTGAENAPYSPLLVDVETGASRALVAPPPAGRMSSVSWNEGGSALLYGQSESFVTVEQQAGRLILQDIDSGRSETKMWLPMAAGTVDILAPETIVMAFSARSQNLMEVDLAGGAPAGKPRWVTRGNSTDRQPVFSADGRWMLFSSNRGGNLDLWKLSLETGAIRRITEDDAGDWDPAFTPDGNILWSSNRGGHFEVWTCSADGTGARQVTQDGLDAENPTATADGRWILYNSSNPEGTGIWKIRPDGSEATRIVPGSWSVPDVSPDGRYVAFRTGNISRSLLVARVEDGAMVGGPWDLPGDNANARARWMPDGRHLLFTGSDDTGARGIFIQEFVPGTDTRSTRKPYHGFDKDQPPESFAVSPDGSRLVYSITDVVESLMLAEGLRGIAP